MIVWVPHLSSTLSGAESPGRAPGQRPLCQFARRPRPGAAIQQMETLARMLPFESAAPVINDRFTRPFLPQWPTRMPRNELRMPLPQLAMMFRGHQRRNGRELTVIWNRQYAKPASSAREGVTSQHLILVICGSAHYVRPWPRRQATSTAADIWETRQ